MSNLRINDASRPTASSPASDDYVAIDGTTNGTRKMLAKNGDVVGPSSAVSGRIAVFSGTSGKVLTDGGVLALNSVVVSAGAGDAGKLTLLDSTGKLDSSVIPGGGGGGGGAPTIVTVAYSATLATDASQAAASCPLVVQVGALTGNITISNPTNPTNRQKLEFVLLQDATGGRTLTLGSKFRFPSSSTLSSPISAANSPDFAVASKKSILLCEYDLADDKWSVVSFVPGY